MTLPVLPAENEDPWYAKRNAFDLAVKSDLEGRLSDAELSATFGQVGRVQFTVARSAGVTTALGYGFTTWPLDGVPSVNVGGGTWDPVTFVYTVPETGTYLCLGSIRALDASPARSLAIAIGDTNADGPHVLWNPFAGTSAEASRSGRQYTRLMRCTAGMGLRLYVYSDHAEPLVTASGGNGQFLSIFKLGA
jgi:hypothetical protein